MGCVMMSVEGCIDADDAHAIKIMCRNYLTIIFFRTCYSSILFAILPLFITFLWYGSKIRNASISAFINSHAS